MGGGLNGSPTFFFWSKIWIFVAILMKFLETVVQISLTSLGFFEVAQPPPPFSRGRADSAPSLTFYYSS